ncbi:MAG: CHC2 zinc finger domain-containing protein [Chloroflexota bacterium]
MPSQKIRQVAPLEPFIAQYVKLDSKGKGYCPFHDDEHKSFRISEGNPWPILALLRRLWHTIGGDVIHFWRMRQKQGQDASFVATITELAGMVLK